MGLPEQFPIHAALIALLSHLEMTEEEAAEHWNALRSRQADLMDRLGRDPGIRVAALDYFTSERRLLSRPKIVDESAMEIAETSAEADGLTGLPNRRTFEAGLRTEIRRAGRRLQQFALALLDLEGFQRVNARYGRATGDGALRETAALIRARLRDMDLAGRLEGAHFGLLMPLTLRSGARVAVDRIRAAVHDAFLRPGLSHPVLGLTLAGGLAAYPDDADTASGLLGCAAESLAAARAQGGNRIVVHHREQRGALRLRPGGSPLKLLVQRPGSDAMHSVRVRDISRSGALLEGREVFAEGERILLHLPGRSPAEPSLSLEATVVRGKQGQDRPCAGIRFSSHPSGGQSALDRFLESIRIQGLEVENG